MASTSGNGPRSRVRPLGVVGAVLRAPVSPRAWLATIHVVVGYPLSVVAFCLLVTLISLTAGLALTAIFAVVPLTLLMVSVRVLTAVQRSRFRALLGVEIPPVPPGEPVEQSRGWLRRQVNYAGSGSTWRQIGYHLTSFVLGTVSFALIVTAWSGGLVLATVYGQTGILPREGIFGWHMRDPAVQGWLTLAGVVLLFAAPWLARVLATLDIGLAGALLGPSRSEQLRTRLDTVTRSRAGVVDAADTERRRIERDLHDGTQQRLVSLAMNLGRARAKLADDAPPATREAIVAAHEEAKQALSELRDFVRGLHPAVLDDRGLDAALSGIAARTPLPVTLSVDVPQRPSPTVEAVAYFVVSEALTNVVKHAAASEARVRVDQVGDRLRLVVADNGRGGAALEHGSGLRGLAQRVASVDGTLRLDSPAGRGTTIEVDLPCAR